MTDIGVLDDATLPAGIAARFVDNGNGLRMHVLEAGHEAHGRPPGRPCLLLLHGFPELAYSWRKIMAPLTEAGFHVVAPDQRGYGRTTGWDGAYDGDVGSFRMLSLVRDTLGLLASRSDAERSPAWPATISALPSPPSARWCAPTCFARSP